MKRDIEFFDGQDDPHAAMRGVLIGAVLGLLICAVLFTLKAVL